MFRNFLNNFCKTIDIVLDLVLNFAKKFLFMLWFTCALFVIFFLFNECEIVFKLTLNYCL